MATGNQKPSAERLPAVEWLGCAPRERVASLKPALARFFGLTEADRERLRAHRSLFAANVEELTGRFYNHLLETPETAAYFSGWSQKRLRALSRKQTDYFLRMLDADFGAGRTREILDVAERHQRLGIPSTWIGAAYAVYLNYGRGRIEAAAVPIRVREQLFNAFERLVFVDRELQLLGYDSDRRLREFHGALAEINQLIAHKPPVERLYRGVCRIAVQRCGLPLAWIGLIAADGVGVDIAAADGVQSEFARNLKLSLNPDSLLSRGAFGRAIRSGAMVVIPDMEAVKGRDLLAKRALGHGLRAMAVLPIRRGDAIIGAMAVYDREADAFTTTVVPLLQTLAADVSYAVTEFRHEAEIERLHEFSLALSDVNQLIARGCQAPRLYAESCRIIARHARVFLACIIRSEPDAAGARVAGAGGEGRPFTERLAAVLAQETNDGHRRGRAPAVHNDLRSPALSARCRAALELFGVGSWAAFPLRSDNGDDYGALVVLARQEDYFSRDLVRLLEETAGDLGFAVADQGRRKKLAEVQGFYAALGDLGALVAACGDAAQLIDHACRLVVAHAGVALAGVVHVDAVSGEVTVRAVAGMLAEYARRVVLSIDPDQPEGVGVVGRVHRSGQSAVIQDTADEPTMQTWRVPPAKYGLHAVAGFPMATDGTGETILILGADEPRYFTPPLVDLLDRIARALGAGLLHIAAAERARRLETLYAALSSVNELIARYPDPLELFTETCHDLAAQLSGVGALVLETGDDAGPRVAAAAGPGSAEKALQECLQRLLQESGNLRSGQEALFNRLPEADELARWRERCAGLEIRSLGLFPIAHEGETMGALAIVSRWQDLFDDELAGLFKRLAANLSFALDQHSRGEALQRLAFTDSLTALPNRALFLDRLQQSVAEAARDNRSLAVGIVDLDGFKQINDRLGHPVGDYVLKEIGRRFEVVSRQSDTVARFGGDEFGLVLRNPHGEAEVQGFLERLLAVISRPIKVERERFVLGASVGISLYPQDAETPDELMRLADLAMYRTKQRGGHGWTFYTEAMERRLLVAHGIQRDFARALRAEELELNYQPQLDFTNGRILGAEALVRWRHPNRGVLLPSGWIEVVEQNGQMVRALGKRVLALAIAQLAAWHRCGLRLSVSVNVGVRHILSPHFLDDLDAALAETPELAPWLGLEITESALIEDFETCRERLQECRRRGLRLAIDDFGVGHASLRYLHQLPVDSIKIDQSFVRNLHDDLRALGIVAGALQASRFSQINAVAEGVETLEQGVVLRRLGCRVMQGYAVARPMPARVFDGWRRKWVMPAEWEKESRHAVGAGHLPLVASMTYHRGVARSLGERSRRSRDAEKRDAVLPSDDACPLRRWGQGWEAGVEMAPELAEAHARLHELEAAAAHPGRFDGGEGDPRVEAARALVEFLDRAEACLRELPPPGQPT